MLAGGTYPNKANLVTQQNISHAIRTTNGSCEALQDLEPPGWIGKMGAIKCQSPKKMDQGSKLFLPPKAYQSFFCRQNCTFIRYSKHSVTGYINK